MTISTALLLFTLTPFTADKVEIIKENGASIVYLLGNVVIEQESTTITCLEARLNETAGNVILNKNVVIKDKNDEIHSENATYYFKEKIGYLIGNVVLSTENETISSDSLNYDGKSRFVRMFENVKIIDKKNDLTAYGGQGWYNLEKEQGNLIENPKLEIARSPSDTIEKNSEPMRVKAKEFQINNKENMFYGFDSVVATIDSITVLCDTFCYDINNEQGTMIKPTVEEKNNELKGTRGQFKLKNKNIDYFMVECGQSTYYTREGSKNVAEGLTIKILFKDGKATKIIAQGNPKGVLNLKKREEDVGH